MYYVCPALHSCVEFPASDKSQWGKLLTWDRFGMNIKSTGHLIPRPTGLPLILGPYI